jgi:hypothetical protein
MTYILEPPPAYVYSFRGDLIVVEKSVAETERACRDAGTAGRDLMACMVLLPFGNGTCVVYLPHIGTGGIGRQSHEALTRHEVAHCNGWPKHHPQ